MKLNLFYLMTVSISLFSSMGQASYQDFRSCLSGKIDGFERKVRKQMTGSEKLKEQGPWVIASTGSAWQFFAQDTYFLILNFGDDLNYKDPGYIVLKPTVRENFSIRYNGSKQNLLIAFKAHLPSVKESASVYRSNIKKFGEQVILKERLAHKGNDEQLEADLEAMKILNPTLYSWWNTTLFDAGDLTPQLDGFLGVAPLDDADYPPVEAAIEKMKLYHERNSKPKIPSIVFKYGKTSQGLTACFDEKLLFSH